MLSYQISGFVARSRILGLTVSNQASRFTRFATVSADAVMGSNISGSGNMDDGLVSRLKVKKILESDDSVLGKKVTVQGWVRTVRDQKKFSFIEINDGSTLTGIQAVAVCEIDTYSEVEKFTTGAAVEVVGTVIASIGKGDSRTNNYWMVLQRFYAAVSFHVRFIVILVLPRLSTV